MPRPLKAKTLNHISAAREGSTYRIQIEDEAGKRALFELTARQALQFADVLDALLADEEAELGLQTVPSRPASAADEKGDPNLKTDSHQPASAAGEEGEAGPKAAPRPSATAAPEGCGVVRWYNTTKGFGFVMPDAGGEELFLHRSTLEQAGLFEIQEGTRVRVAVAEGKKGPQVSTIALA